MREILFRGKRVNDGEWVEGNLFIPDKKDTPTQICIGTNVVRISYDILPETVGQYTGLTDKNGTKIFEGDIVKLFLDGGIEVGVIAFNDIGLRHMFCTKEGKFGIDKYCTFEVIGNIHDYPELFGGDGD